MILNLHLQSYIFLLLNQLYFILLYLYAFLRIFERGIITDTHESFNDFNHLIYMLPHNKKEQHIHSILLLNDSTFYFVAKIDYICDKINV